MRPEAEPRVSRAGGRRGLVAFLAAMLLGVPLAATGQPRAPRVGLLSTAALPAMAARYEAFRQALRELGWVESTGVVFEYRSGEGDNGRLPALAAELVRLGVDCIVTAGDTPTRAAKDATGTIPIVMANAQDPLRGGFVASLARPGGNVTGLSSVSRDLAGKRLALLREAVPRLSRVALFGDPRSLASSPHDFEDAARQLKVQLVSIQARGLDELDGAFRSAVREQASAALLEVTGLFVTHRKAVVELAARYRLPVMYPEQEFVAAGGLMAYATSVPELYRRAAGYVDRILRGARPADLPVEQPTKVDLIVNLRTARALGLTIPAAVLARADEVIE